MRPKIHESRTKMMPEHVIDLFTRELTIETVLRPFRDEEHAKSNILPEGCFDIRIFEYDQEWRLSYRQRHRIWRN